MQYCFTLRKVMSQKIKIYHNPACGTSRNTLELIRNTGQEPEIIEYLKIPPTKEELITLIEESKRVGKAEALEIILPNSPNKKFVQFYNKRTKIII